MIVCDSCRTPQDGVATFLFQFQRSTDVIGLIGKHRPMELCPACAKTIGDSLNASLDSFVGKSLMRDERGEKDAAKGDDEDGA